MSVLIVAVNKVPVCAWRGWKTAKRRGPLNWVLKGPSGVYRSEAEPRGRGGALRWRRTRQVKGCVQMLGGLEGLGIIVEQ